MTARHRNDSIWSVIESWEPYITLRLIVVNIFVYLVSAPLHRAVESRFALEYGSVVYLHEHYRMFTAMFLHSHEIISHVFMNMLMLYFLGFIAERAYGRSMFLLVYVGAGYMGFVIALLIQGPGSITLGASGAVMGLLGAWLAYERSLRISFKHLWQSPSGRRVMVFTGLYVVINLLDFDPKTSWSAHLGGILGGYLLGYFVATRRYRGRTAPLQGWLALAAYLAIVVGVMVYLHVRTPVFIG